MAGRKTKPITFNLADRGRQYTGQDRSNVSLKAWIDVFNSNETQEMIETGSMLGYYGHQVRMLFGLTPPETVLVDGKLITISPAVRTIELHADQDGNVTHREEFLDTPEGEYALQKYKARVGGFSFAHDYVGRGGVVIPTSCGGADYVLQPNYAGNIGDGVLLDGVLKEGSIRNLMELDLLQMYDSIHETNFALHLADSNMMRAIESENKLLEFQENEKRRKQLIGQKEQNLLDSTLCSTVSLDEYMQQGKAFIADGVNVVTSIEPKESEPHDSKFKIRTGIFGMFG